MSSWWESRCGSSGSVSPRVAQELPSRRRSGSCWTRAPEQAVRVAVVWGNQRWWTAKWLRPCPCWSGSPASRRAVGPAEGSAGAADARPRRGRSPGRTGEGRAVQALIGRRVAARSSRPGSTWSGHPARRVGDLDRARQPVARDTGRALPGSDHRVAASMRGCGGSAAGRRGGWRGDGVAPGGGAGPRPGTRSPRGAVRSRRPARRLGRSSGDRADPGCRMELRCGTTGPPRRLRSPSPACCGCRAGSEATGILDPRDAVRTRGPWRWHAVAELAARREGLHQLGEARDLLGEVDAPPPPAATWRSACASRSPRAPVLASDDLEGARESPSPAWEQAQGGGLVAGVAPVGGPGEALAPDDPVEGAPHRECPPTAPQPLPAAGAGRGGGAARARPGRSTRRPPGRGSTPGCRMRTSSFRLERALGDAAFASRAGDVARAERAERSAKQALAEIRQALDSTDAAALKVHPWRVRLERGRVRGD